MEGHYLSNWATPTHVVNEGEPVSELVGEAGTQYCHKPHSQYSNPQLGRNSEPGVFPWGVKALNPTLGTPNLRPTLKRWAPKHLALKITRAHVHKTHKATMICETTLKGLARLDSSAPGLSAEPFEGPWLCQWGSFSNFEVSTWRVTSNSVHI